MEIEIDFSDEEEEKKTVKKSCHALLILLFSACGHIKLAYRELFECFVMMCNI